MQTVVITFTFRISQPFRLNRSCCQISASLIWRRTHQSRTQLRGAWENLSNRMSYLSRKTTKCKWIHSSRSLKTPASRIIQVIWGGSLVVDQELPLVKAPWWNTTEAVSVIISTNFIKTSLILMQRLLRLTQQRWKILDWIRFLINQSMWIEWSTLLQKNLVPLKR